MFQTNPVAIMARKKLVKPQKTSTPVASPSSSSSSGGFLAPQEVSPVRKRAKHRHDAGVLREIRKLQRSTDLLVPRLPFSRVVREVASQCGQQELRLLLFTILERMLNLKSNSPGSSWPP